MKNKINPYLLFGYWMAVFLLFTLFLQTKGAFHFTFIEQWNLLVYDPDFISAYLKQPGGLATLASYGCAQFYPTPFAGAVIWGAVLTLICVVTERNIHRIAPQKPFYLLELLPAITFLFVMFNTGFSYAGIIAFLVALLALWGVTALKSWRVQLIYTLLLTPLLYWAIGAATSLFVVGTLLAACKLKGRKGVYQLLSIALLCGCAVVSIYLSWIGEYRFAFTPEGYFARDLQAPATVWLPWIAFVSLILISLIPLKEAKWNRIGFSLCIAFQSLLVIGIWQTGWSRCYNPADEQFKELDTYLRNEQWDKILQRCDELPMNNYLYQCMHNIALAETGQLGERMFEYPQQGLQSIYLQWDSTPYVAVLLSDLYYSMGAIAFSQRMAFEANLNALNYNPRLLQRLVQTNLLLGADRVADKYLSVLEKTRNYHDWATAQRHLLHHPQALAKDKKWGLKLRCIPREDVFCGKNGIDYDLKKIAEQNPAHRISVQYAGALYLLVKDLDRFHALMQQFAGTKALPTLPKAFKEAELLYNQSKTVDPKQLHTYWNYYYYKNIM